MAHNHVECRKKKQHKKKKAEFYSKQSHKVTKREREQK